MHETFDQNQPADREPLPAHTRQARLASNRGQPQHEPAENWRKVVTNRVLHYSRLRTRRVSYTNSLASASAPAPVPQPPAALLARAALTPFIRATNKVFIRRQYRLRAILVHVSLDPRHHETVGGRKRWRKRDKAAHRHGTKDRCV